jgi:hypothetical protein
MVVQTCNCRETPTAFLLFRVLYGILALNRPHTRHERGDLRPAALDMPNGGADLYRSRRIAAQLSIIGICHGVVTWP